MIVMGKETFLAPEILFQVGKKLLQWRKAQSLQRYILQLIIYWTWMFAWPPIFAYVLISEMSVWMDTEVEGYVKGSG